jgi:NAD(P)-dependent dehydrogenase (short-subunit alcohol dehydrogenase family)
MTVATGLTGKVVMLVGVGTPGVVSSNGRATAAAFVSAGAKLILVDNSERRMHPVQS